MCTSQKEIEFFQLLEIDLCAISQPFRRFRLGVRQKSEIESRHHLPTKALDTHQPSSIGLQLDNLWACECVSTEAQVEWKRRAAMYEHTRPWSTAGHRHQDKPALHKAGYLRGSAAAEIYQAA